MVRIVLVLPLAAAACTGTIDSTGANGNASGAGGGGGTAAVPGTSITVKGANGATFDMVAQLNGNFYTSQAIVFPITVYASQCPASTPMSSSIATGNGGCNKSGCHASGAQGHIHL